MVWKLVYYNFSLKDNILYRVKKFAEYRRCLVLKATRKPATVSDDDSIELESLEKINSDENSDSEIDSND